MEAVVTSEPSVARERGVGNGPVAGRFVLLYRMGATAEDDAYVTSWDTWDECAVAFPLERGFFLLDQETNREWLPGAHYEWEDART